MKPSEAIKTYRIARENASKFPGICTEEYWRGYIYALWLEHHIDSNTWTELDEELIKERHESNTQPERTNVN